METTTEEKWGFLLTQVGSRSLSHLAKVSEPNGLHIIAKWEDNFYDKTESKCQASWHYSTTDK